MTNVPVSTSPAAAAPTTRRGVALYLLVAFAALAVLLVPFAIGALDAALLAPIVPLGQWIPALAVVVVGAVTGQKGLLPGRRRPSWSALATTLGVFAAVLALHLALGAGLGLIGLDLGGLPTGAAVLPLAAFLMLATLGEEIGWRGYLLGQWRSLGPWGASVSVAAVWSAWHIPLLALYVAHGVMSVAAAVASTVNLVCGGALLGMLRLRTESLWPAVFGHALMNSLFVWGYGLVSPGLGDVATPSYWAFSALGWVLLLAAAAVVQRSARSAGPEA